MWDCWNSQCKLNIQYKCTEIYCAAAWTSCPPPSVLPSQHRKAHPCNNCNVFLTFSKSIIYTLCCTLGCLSAFLWFWPYLRKSQSRWACREQRATHTVDELIFYNRVIIGSYMKKHSSIILSFVYLIRSNEALIALILLSLTGQCFSKSSEGLIWHCVPNRNLWK